MFWPVEAVLLLVALAGCWCAAAAAETAWRQRSRTLAVVAVAVTASLAAEAAALNGAALGGELDGIGLVSLLMAGVALGGLAVYLLMPVPQEHDRGHHLGTPSGPAADPDSEA